MKLEINGFPVEAQYDEGTVQGIFMPFLRQMGRLQRARRGRLVVFLAAPPATGKSTLAAFLQQLAGEMEDLPPVQALGMDGFHYPQAYIRTHTVVRGGKEIPMARVKGAPDTFDAALLRQKLAAVSAGDANWPFYDRRLHDVVPDAVAVTAPILLVEGNYLLLDDPAWRGMEHNYSVFIRAEEESLRERLIERKVRGGLDRAAAEAFYEECDGPNVRLCLSHSLPADMTLRMLGDGRFIQED